MSVMSSAEDADRISLAFPVVAKILSQDIAHKSDIGGVKIGIVDATALREAYRELIDNGKRNAPGARIDGVVVQEMARGVGEAIVGFRRDPLVGPIVAVGVGGILAEVYGDVAIRPAPVDEATARAMVSEVKGFAPMRGFRGLPEGDLAALADIVIAMSRLALSDRPAIAEAEINPVIVRAKDEGAVAVDGVVIAAEA